VLTEAVILAGGFGTRLQAVVNDVPKPMAPVNGQPFLSFILTYLRSFGINHVVISTGYLAEKINSFYQGQYNGMRISYTKEENPLGTGGGIRLALEKCSTEHILVLNGDSFFDVDIQTYYHKHCVHDANASLALRMVQDASRYGTIQSNSEERITAFNEKDGKHVAGLINGGVYILNRNVFLNSTEPGQPFSIEKDFYEKRITDMKIFGYEFDGYFIDIGIPEDYRKAQDDFKEFKYKIN
jgi:D-glycero-alpha-D-manno-heptose 1-phosphate guanylyltransferase